MISKLQRVVCHLNDRISTVEQMSGIAPPAIVPVTTGMMLLLLLFLRLPPLRLCHSPSFFSPVPHKKDEVDAEDDGGVEGGTEGGRKRLKRKR